ncbi:MAG: NAD(P)-binding domain-containing protein, partial [Candidatus Peribacteraceae bacterium]|nr:NAD(P)-binding domain-containing protein [Candidatus Peribacteraceae bacterium]
MKIAIIGFGKMGHAIEAVALAAKHEVVAKIDPSFALRASEDKPAGSEKLSTEISAESLNGAEVAIDFTHPDVVLENLKKLTELKVPTVVGTTGWYDALPEVEKMVSENSAALLYAGNFSVGVQTFYAIVENA